MNVFPKDSAIILVHGAWADGSCWSNVILPLQRHGLKVICAPLPLTSLTDDVAALRRALERTSGPVVLAGHAYAGAVIGAADDTRVKSLVFVAALAPDEGETVSQVFYRGEPHPDAPKLIPDPHGLLWMPEEGFRRAVAHRASADQISIMAALQRPIALQCIDEASPAPAWKTEAIMVLARRRRPHDQPEDPAFHGRSYGREHPLGACGPYSDVRRAAPRDRSALGGGA